MTEPATHLASRIAELEATLERRVGERSAAVGENERTALKQTIVALIRDADGEAQRAVALQAAARALAAKWKQLPASPAAEPPAAPAPLTERVDHLGASTFVAKGWSAISRGDYEAAERSLEQALRLAPEDLEARTLCGWALMGQARYDDALVALNAVLARAPQHELARANVGYVCLRKGIYGEAIEHLATAARGADRKAVLYATHYLGLVYLHREMFDDAAGCFRRALALGPNLHEASYELGRALWFAGDRDGAIATWRGAASSGKFNEWARRCGERDEAAMRGEGPPAVGEGLRHASV